MVDKKFFRRFTGTMATVAAAASLTFVPVASAAPDSYPDVKKGDSHYEGIMALTKEGVVKGYENGKFGQWDDITRQQVAVILYEAFDLEEPKNLDNVLSVYDDIDSKHIYAKQIAGVTEAGIFKGSSGSFHPGKMITREQVASVILLAKDLEEYDSAEVKEIELDNVDASHKERVQILANLGITNQYENYRAQQPISRGAFSTMLYKLGQKVDELGSKYQLYDNKIIKDINVDSMYDNIAYLSEVPREAGTDGEVRAVEYIESEFKKLGYETEIQPFPIYDYKSEANVQIDGTELESPHAFNGSESGKVTAPLEYVGKASPEEVGDVEGKIALIKRGDLTFVEKVQNVLDKGAVGVIMFNNNDNGNYFGEVRNGQNIPAVAITKEAGQKLVEQLDSSEVSATLDVNTEKIEKTSYNVIASMKPDQEQDTGQLITIGAHHDSVPGGPGANDDGSGVSAVLELARIYADSPIDTEVRFMTFGSEERGLVGSSYYVDSLPQSEIDRMVAHFQMDMIGGRDAGADNPAGGLIMYTIDGEKNLVTDLSAASASRMLTEMIPYGQLGRSDHQPFHDVGIPSALFIHSPVEPWYHQPTDTIDKISKEKLQQVAEIVGSSAYQIARPETPALANDQVAEGFVDYQFEDRPVD
ncbi:M28 family peptidase [Virgibacillus sp. FSP13]